MVFCCCCIFFDINVCHIFQLLKNREINDISLLSFILLLMQEIDPKAGGGHPMTIGTMVRQLLTKLDWYDSLFPRIPVPIQVLNLFISKWLFSDVYV